MYSGEALYKPISYSSYTAKGVFQWKKWLSKCVETL